MKKAIISLVTFICCGMLVSCGLGTAGLANSSLPSGSLTSPAPQTPQGGDILGSVVNQVAGGNSLLSGIISTFAPGLTTNQSTIVGTWRYSKPCVQFESENLLAQAGGAVASNKVVEKLTTVYQLVGIKPGACTFTFTKDNKVNYILGGKSLNGTYSYNASKKTITITTQTGVNITAYVSVAGNNMGLTFDSSKLLSLVGSSSVLSGGIAPIMGNYTGMKIGFELSK